KGGVVGIAVQALEGGREEGVEPEAREAVLGELVQLFGLVERFVVYFERALRDLDAELCGGNLLLELVDVPLRECGLLLPVVVAPLERGLEAGRSGGGLGGLRKRLACRGKSAGGA